MIVDLAVCVGAFVAALAGVNLTSRNVFAMAREGGMPRPFAWTHPRFGSPWAAIATVIALTLALVLVLARIVWDDPFKYFGFMATTATFAILGAYILIALAGMVFFWRRRVAGRRVPDRVRPRAADRRGGDLRLHDLRVLQGARSAARTRPRPWIALAWLGVGDRRAGVADHHPSRAGAVVRLDPRRERGTEPDSTQTVPDQLLPGRGLAPDEPRRR